MKNCPTCSRTYEDDTLAFCLEDGSRLSAAYNPQATHLESAARDPKPPRTVILPADITPANPAPPPLRSTIPAMAPLTNPQAALQSQPPEKRGGQLWIVLSGILALAVVGLVILLGYMGWKATDKTSPDPATLTSAAPTNSNVSANASNKTESKPAENAILQWLDGVWEGQGYQSNTKTTWATRLTVNDGVYAVDYPGIPCSGKWTLIDYYSSGASFDEVITQGTKRCINSQVKIEKVNESEISCKYTSRRVVIATAVLRKKS